MANPLRGESDFVAGGVHYRLRFSANAICELETILRRTIVDLAEELGEGKVSMTIVRALLYAGLHDAHPELTLNDAGDLVEAGGGLFPVYEQVGAAFALAFPPKVVKADPMTEASPAVANGNGLNS